MSKTLSIIGASGHGKIVLAVARQLDYDVTAFYDDNKSLLNLLIHDVPVKGGIQSFDFNTNAFIAIGNNKVRRDISAQFKDNIWTSLIHPRACVDKTVKVGSGALVCAGATIQIDSSIGVHTIINTNASVDHDSMIGDFVHVAPGVNLAGNVTVGCGAMIGIGAAVLPGLRIGKNSIVGAGSVVTHDIPDNTIVVGCPAKELKKRDYHHE